MSSMRNAVQRRNHKERAQPLERQKWGILEKHKDYSLRAKDHNAKKRKISALKQKAADRNEDEFYFGMMSSTTAGGVKRAKRGEENNGGGKVLSENVVKLMKTQDAGYLRTVLQQTKRERQRVEKAVIVGEVGVEITGTSGSNKITFEDADGMAVSAHGQNDDDEHFSLEELAIMADLDPYAPLEGEDESSSDEETDTAHPPKPVTKAERATAKKKRYSLAVQEKYLLALQKREKDLATALREVEEQRAKMNKTVGGTNKDGIKFKVRQRKR